VGQPVVERHLNLDRAVFVGLAFVVLTITACASGSAIVTGTTKTPVAANQVTVYLEPPSEYEVIGIVNASSDAGWTQQGAMDYAVEELKKQAGKLGANGVLLMSAGERITGIVVGPGKNYSYSMPVTEMTVQAQAIFVNSQ
jgi:hypothetical protein